MLDSVSNAKVKIKKRAEDLNKKSEVWFDNECRLSKENMNHVSKKFSKTPKDNLLRRQVFEAKKNFKKIILTKKRKYRKKLVDDLQNSERKNSKDFWKKLRKLSPKNISDPRQPSITEFREYFQNLSHSDRPQDVPPLNQENGPLDFIISLEELTDAAKRLKYGKAHGVDIICNEMIIPLVQSHPDLLLCLFNKILESSEIMPDWIVGLIVPVFKDGSKMDPGNYRGITLMSCLGKLFLSILNARLLTFALEKNIIRANQLGFVPGNRTSDAHIIINNLVNKICHKNNKKLYSCFVDFRKAFDLVPRDILLKKLLNYGINGKFFNIIRNIYTNDKASVKLNGKSSTTFNVNVGVRQGCILSPLLFNIFLSDLARSLQGNESVTIGSLNSIFWADDLVMFADSEDGLQNMLNLLEKYSNENYLTVNTKKTKCMIFNKNGRLLLRPFYLNNTRLECVRLYKYLGFMITPSGEINTGLKDLRDRAFRAFMKIRRDLGPSFNQNVPLILSLIDSLVKPILLYASDFWGCFKLPKSNQIDTFYMSMMKQVLGVQKQTVNDGVLLELGRTPLSFDAKKLSIKNWERIIRGKANKPLLLSLQESVDLELPWTSHIKTNMESIGLLHFYTANRSSKNPFVFKKVFQRLCDIFHQEIFASFTGDRSKLRTYATFKKDPGYESYLSNIKNTKIRVNVSKFRLSNHKLMIEAGRYKKLNANERFCPFCPHVVEDEIHFLFDCPSYHPQRARLIDPIVNQLLNAHSLTVEQRFEYVMSNMDKNLCNYISNSMDLREFLLSNPKQQG